MGKKKKAAPIRQFKGFGKRNLSSELNKAETLIQEGEIFEAKTFLLDLLKVYPREPEIFKFLTDIHLRLGDRISYIRSVEQLIELEPEDLPMASGLAEAYRNLDLYLMSLQTYQMLVERQPDSFRTEYALSEIEDLQPLVEERLQALAVPEEEKRSVLLRHEQGRLYLEEGELDQAQPIQEQLLQEYPTFVAARNTLSQIQFERGEISAAIAESERVLDQDPNNASALADRVHYHFIRGEIDQAQSYGDRVKHLSSSCLDTQTEQVRALSYLGDDQGIVEIFDGVETADQLDLAPARFHHWVAVALAHLGRVESAIEQWEEALQKDPDLKIAEDNLESIREDDSFHREAWSFAYEDWIGDGLLREIDSAMHQFTKGEDPEVFLPFQARHPYFPQIFKIVLERTDPISQFVFLVLARKMEHPELTEILKGFAFGQSGTEHLRYEAAANLYKNGVFDEEIVTLWLAGEWQPIRIFTQVFHEDKLYNHSRQVGDWLQKGTSLIKSGDLEGAERLLSKALQAEPNAPDIRFNLATCLLVQGSIEDSLAMSREILEQYPDYSYPRITLASHAISQGDLDAAEEWLNPILNHDRLHYSEFSNLCRAYVHLLAAKGQNDVARAWLNAWALIDPEGFEVAADNLVGEVSEKDPL